MHAGFLQARALTCAGWSIHGNAPSEDVMGVDLYLKLSRSERILFNASFDRCLETCKVDIDFVNCFYSKLRSSDTEVAKILDSFPLGHRVQTLRHSIYTMIEFSERRMSANQLVNHSCAYLQDSLKPCMLDLWLNSLILAVSEFDRNYTPDILALWYRVMEPGVSLIKKLLAQEALVKQQPLDLRRETEIYLDSYG